MASKTRRTKRGDTELAIGDLVAWTTASGVVLVWVVNVLPQQSGAVPLLEVLEGIGEGRERRPEALRAAEGAPHEKGRRWFVATDMRATVDPGRRYARIASGFTRAGFTPTNDSKHGLHAPWRSVKELAGDLAGYAAECTPAGKAKAAREANAAADEDAARAKARAEALTAAKPMLRRKVELREMAKPRTSGARRFVLSLTGKESHAVWFPLGVGNMSIGPGAPATRETPHAVVHPGERLHWDALDELPKTGGGSAMPRWLAYEGDDASIFAWLARRASPLERLDLVPTAPLDVDARAARFGALVVVTTHRVPVSLVLHEEAEVIVRGDPALVALRTAKGATLAPRVEPRSDRGVSSFAGWSIGKRGLSVANAALRRARRDLAALPRADAKKARAIVKAFVEALNALHATKGNTLLTSEREDVAEAVTALFATPALSPLADDARAWLDAHRDF
ncbi:MAG: hypothetical protein JST00_07155 [Deltaproteobacteria bacterium]|nr:hypothetical protein [Deltaproteobacteria bacterium]